jgi:CspA family cold shock protein
MKNLMLIVGALMLFGLVAKAQPARVDKPTEWKPNTTVLVSPNQQYRLSYQSDGNLVVYDKSNKPLWNSQTNGKTPNKLVFQADGNLVLYGANNAVHWAAYCHNKGGKSLRLNDQGSLSVWSDNNYIWNTGNEIVSSNGSKPIDNRLHGRVRFFNNSKGYGYIKDNKSGKEYYVHVSGFKDVVKQNDAVVFDLQEGKDGLNAVNVELE